MTDRREGNGDEEGPVGDDDSGAATEAEDGASSSESEADPTSAGDDESASDAESDDAESADEAEAEKTETSAEAESPKDEAEEGSDEVDEESDETEKTSDDDKEESDEPEKPSDEESDESDEAKSDEKSKDEAKSDEKSKDESKDTKDDTKSDEDDAKGSKASRWWMVLVALIVVEFWVYGKRGEIEVCVGKQGAHDFALIGQERNDANRWKFPRCETRENLGLRSHYDEMVEDATKVACRGATLFRQQGEGPQCVEGKDGWSTQVETSFIWPWDARYYNHLLWFLE